MRLKAIIFILTLSFNLRAQVFWTEIFGAGACSSGAAASGFVSANGTWTVTNTGTNNSSANAWFVSAKERGMGVGVCGAGCGGTNNKTLHLGATGFFLDPGAAYNETGAANITDKRVESPIINCSGRTGITLSFSYMEFGQGTADNATLWYFNGTVWALLIDIPKTLCCNNTTCNGFNQGLWVNYAIALPASANNNPNVRIGFRWVNNGNGVGTDPSVAIDDITLSVPVVVPIELLDFTVKKSGNTALLKWSTMTEKKFDGFIIERSKDGLGFTEIGFVKGSGNSNSQINYSFVDKDILPGLIYYRLKAIDIDKSYNYSPIRALDFTAYVEASAFYNLASSEIILPLHSLNIREVFTLDLISTEGKTIKSIDSAELKTINNELHIPIGSIPFGLYILKLYDAGSAQNFRVLIAE